ncbi:hypothetical protein [Planctobacterium marinum]|uniref:General secretion pathway protein K n=1 Tax=Planctobacterium marinum TaxID=1631968 RepID=A0AA48HZW4_9ALTE|nr:hypothetical protein MACH26_32110 [Planctobacterium marinum]
MIFRKQQGIALVQVLLISTVLMLLVVQLSSKANNAVEIATELKHKAGAETKIQSAMAHIQFALLTQSRVDFDIQALDRSLGFFGEPQRVEADLTVEIQDMAGLLSTSFIGIGWDKYLNGNANQLNTIRKWQGMDDYGVASAQMRNARIPYIEEVLLLPGLEGTDLTYLTNLPTGFFNVGTAPDGLLSKVFGELTAQRIAELRESREFSRDTVNQIDGLQEASVFPPGTMARVKITSDRHDRKDSHVSRGRYFQLQPGNDIPIIEIGLTTK